MYTLYSRAGSGGFVVEAALELAGAPFTLVDVPKSQRDDPEFRKISPFGQVPVLALPDGGLMTESAAMCILIAERHAEAGLAPAPGEPERADFLRWMMFFSTVIYQADLRVYYAPRYTTDPNGADGVKQAGLAEMDAGLAVIDRALAGRDWLLDQRSIADVYLLMLHHWHPEMERARRDFPNIERVCATLRDDPLLARRNGTHELW